MKQIHNSSISTEDNSVVVQLKSVFVVSTVKLIIFSEYELFQCVCINFVPHTMLQKT